MTDTTAQSGFDAWLGREEECSDSLTDTLVGRFRATFDLPSTSLQTGEPAPRLIHFCLCQPFATTASLGLDGHPAKGAFLPPIPLPRRMWASSDIRFSGDLRIGDRVTRQSRVAAIEEKTGRSGSLYFVTVEHHVEGSAGAVDDRQTIVYRDAETGSSAAPAPAASIAQTAPVGHSVSSIIPSSTLLFRYSALTFNGHRIHYDLPYAQGEEGYADLVVHGPLQATLLYQHATRHGGSEPSVFNFRGQSPIIGQQAIQLHATPISQGEMDLWTARRDAPVATKAKAVWA